MSGDAHHIVTPPPDGNGATALCMTRAMAHAGASAADICYVNAHATSTPVGGSSPTALITWIFSGLLAGLDLYFYS